MEEPGEVELSSWGGAGGSRARRAGEVVYRTAGPWSGSVLSLLRHFEAVGFDGAPRVIGDGFDEHGREQLSFLPGTSPHPGPWSDDAAHALGALLRRAHDASLDFVPPRDAVWQDWHGRRLPGSRPVFGHGDTGAWNVLAAEDGIPHAFVDWEFAGPVDALWELAQLTWLNAQLFDDDIAERVGLGPPEQRAAQARLVVDGYGLDRDDRRGLVGRMIALAVHDARAEAVAGEVGPQSADGIRADGYPLLWAIAWRARSASWMLRHQQVLEHALQ